MGIIRTFISHSNDDKRRVHDILRRVAPYGARPWIDDQDLQGQAGCSLHDLIQPAFSFLVGAALPFSIASRKSKGQTFGQMLGHAVRRALLLIFLGIFLRSLGSRQTYFTFEDTLTQIGLGYVFLFLLAFTRPRTQVVTLVLILICFWTAFALYPAPGPRFDYARVGVPQNWSHNYTGFLSHWNKNSNLAWAFDVWFLNLFPREQPFVLALADNVTG